jgi:negative regulator of flagellin synthesis FlgM
MMKINRPVGPDTLKLYQQQSTPVKKEKSTKAQQKDQLEISTTAKSLLESKEVEEMARQEKIDQLKQQLEQGTYKVNSREVADKFYQFWYGK